MKDYSRFTAKDFALDEFFQNWITRPDETSNSFWGQWLKNHSQKGREVVEAKRLIENLRFENFSLSEKDIDELWSRINKVK